MYHICRDLNICPLKCHSFRRILPRFGSKPTKCTPKLLLFHCFGDNNSSSEGNCDICGQTPSASSYQLVHFCFYSGGYLHVWWPGEMKTFKFSAPCLGQGIPQMIHQALNFRKMKTGFGEPLAHIKFLFGSFF